jgi:two-component system response regulator AtoC
VASVFVVEDEENLRFTIRRALEKAGHEVADAGTYGDALSALEEVSIDLLITDVNLAGDDGIELVRKLRGDGFDGAIIVITAFASIDNAVHAMREGADEYLQKPLSLDGLVVIAERALSRRKAHERLQVYERMRRAKGSRRAPLGEHESWLGCLELARRMAMVPTSVGSGAGELTTILLLGETGVGKGILARYIHDQGPEPDAPFVHLNCAALPATLVESELFGHEKGAFTDAKDVRRGLFEMADGGTIFLDEIGEMPIELQVKLLSILEHGVFRRIGGTKERRVRVRVIAATNHDLAAQVEAGAFRRDLFYRLNAMTVVIPPLRERGDDMLIMADHVVADLCRRYAKAPMTLGDEARAAMRSHPWPGNVRELMNALQRAVMLTDHEVLAAADLGLAATTPHVKMAKPESAAVGDLQFDFDRGVHTMEEVERTLILQALARTGGNVTQAARLIGMNRSSLRYRIERYGLEKDVSELSAR